MNSFHVKKTKSSILDGLILYEYVDLDILDKLINSNLLLERVDGTTEFKNEKAMLMKYKKCFRDGRITVKYSLNKDIRYGRVFALKSLSLGSFRKVIRHTLSYGYYIDIDVVNCHPRILYQLCKNSILKSEDYQCLREYVYDRETYLNEIISSYGVDRESAKLLFIRLMYFGGFKGWCKDNSLKNVEPLNIIVELTSELNYIGKTIESINPNLHLLLKDRPRSVSSVCAYVLQDYERRILECVYNYLKDTLNRECVLCYDGLMIPKELYYNELLDELSKQVKDKLGFRLKFSIKEMEDNFLNDLSNINDKVEINDGYAAKIFINLMKDKIFKDNDVLYIFDGNDGMWKIATASIIADTCLKFGNEMIFKETIAGKIYKHDYSGSSRKHSAMLTYVKGLVSNKDVIDSMKDTTARKLLFEDGIFDMDTFEFKEYFDPNLLFFTNISYKFKEILEIPNEDAINEVQLKLFEHPFSLDLDYGKYLKQYIARALSLDYYIKKCLFGIGNSNSAKGTITTALKRTFRNFVGEWDGNNLKYNPNDSRDESIKLKFLMKFKGKRLMIGNEIRQDKNKIDSTIIKKIASGGDSLTIRELHSNEIEFTNQALFIILANDMPEIFPIDDAVIKRLRYMRFTTNFVEEPKDSSEIKIDITFRQRWNIDLKLINGMFWTIMRCWKNEMLNQPYWEPECIIEETKGWIGEKNLLTLLKDNFELTYDENDYVLFSEIKKELKELFWSDTKLGRELTKLGFKIKNVTEYNKTCKARLGLKYL